MGGRESFQPPVCIMNYNVTSNKNNLSDIQSQESQAFIYSRPISSNQSKHHWLNVGLFQQWHIQQKSFPSSHSDQPSDQKDQPDMLFNQVKHLRGKQCGCTFLREDNSKVVEMSSSLEPGVEQAETTLPAISGKPAKSKFQNNLLNCALSWWAQQPNLSPLTTFTWASDAGSYKPYLH